MQTLNSHNKDEYPPMHTAEHILNQTMVRLYGCGRSFNAHIERKKSKCDYRISHKLLPAEVEAVERAVNAVIEGAVEVTERFVPIAEAAQFLDLNRLPSDVASTIRVVEIGSYDACACIGAHVHNTREIGAFKIISTDFSDGVVRIRFRVAAVS